MEFETVLARSVVRIIEAADQSPALGGREVVVDGAEIGDQLASRREARAHRSTPDLTLDPAPDGDEMVGREPVALDR